MSVNAKHIATFLFSAAAGLAAAKYMSMSPAENEKLAADSKGRANKLKTAAEELAGKAGAYFEELKTKGAQDFKAHLSNAEKMMNDLFGKKDAKTSNT
ncbi:MAG: hypothetical protein JST86_02890 [Bacteroidetes bacterium]|nr:hypothetical protein [Bacteroidota bacterium]